MADERTQALREMWEAFGRNTAVLERVESGLDEWNALKEREVAALELQGVLLREKNELLKAEQARQAAADVRWDARFTDVWHTLTKCTYDAATSQWAKMLFAALVPMLIAWLAGVLKVPNPYADGTTPAEKAPVVEEHRDAAESN